MSHHVDRQTDRNRALRKEKRIRHREGQKGGESEGEGRDKGGVEWRESENSQ